MSGRHVTQVKSATCYAIPGTDLAVLPRTKPACLGAWYAMPSTDLVSWSVPVGFKDLVQMKLGGQKEHAFRDKVQNLPSRIPFFGTPDATLRSTRPVLI
eukprot:353060-Rhodomonas_salina.1